jgi:hypothetical protein
MREVAGTDSGGTTALTIAGQVLGTPFYMSPEQWGEVPDDGNVEIDGRADIYSLGVVIYELIAGRRPFLGLTLQELRREHVTVTARPLHEVVPDVPEAFSRAISRAMSKDRSNRQTTAGEFSAELRASLGLPALAGSSPSLNLSSGTHGSPPDVNAGGSGSAGSTGLTTNENAEARHTSADVIGPTIITMDSPPRPQAQSAPPPLAATSLAQPMPAPSSASYTPTPNFPSYDAQSSPYVATPAAAKPRSASKLPIIIGAAILLVAGGIGGWYLLSNRGESKANANNSNNAGVAGKKETPPANTNGNAGGPTVGSLEALNYWLEIEKAGPNGDSARVAGVVPLASKQSFKFHFTPRTSGYLYIIGPGPDGKPLTFLTAEPAEDSGVESNELEGGVDYIFPEDEENKEHWITLDKNPGTESYTVIFSPVRLTSPAFLDKEAGSELTAAERKELEDFQAKYKANAPSTAVVNGGGTDPLVSVKVPQAAAPSEPVIFDVRIEHK